MVGTPACLPGSLSARCHLVINDGELGAIPEPRPRAGELRLGPGHGAGQSQGLQGPWSLGLFIPSVTPPLRTPAGGLRMPSQPGVTARASSSLPNPKPRGLLGPQTETHRQAGTPPPPTSSLRKLRLSGLRLQVRGGARASRPGSVPEGHLHRSPCRRSSKELTRRLPQPEVPPERLTTALRRPPWRGGMRRRGPTPCAYDFPASLRGHAHLPNRSCAPALLSGAARKKLVSRLHRFALTCPGLARWWLAWVGCE